MDRQLERGTEESQNMQLLYFVSNVGTRVQNPVNGGTGPSCPADPYRCLSDVFRISPKCASCASSLYTVGALNLYLK